jgi:cobalt-zinc-cadmium efflux system outer membrane protein
LATRRTALGYVVLAMAAPFAMPDAAAQGPTLPTGPGAAPGSTVSSLGPTPGAGAIPFGFMPGAGEMVLGGGRPGPSFPRVPASISTPGRGTATPLGIAAPGPLPIANLALYGTLALPGGTGDDGPPDGLTLDQAIDRLVRDNLDLRSKAFEIPQAHADVLTAGLRANPILYADSQLVPYGRYSRDRPGGATQYDVNVSHPFDLSRKRQARTVVAERAVSVLEAQYQNAVRVQINNLYIAYVDVLAARETVRFAQASVAGLDRVLRVTETFYKRADATRPEVVRIRMQRQAAEIGTQEAWELLLRARRTLAMLLNLPADRAAALELRGTIADRTPPPPAVDDLVRIALEARPDLAARRLGVGVAEGDVRLAVADRFADVYVLYQPYTFQDNAPFGSKSATSWALGATAPVPIFHRNQGGIRRALLSVTQRQVESAGLEHILVVEVTQAAQEYAVSHAAVQRFEADILPDARQMQADALRLFTRGDYDVRTYFNFQQAYNLTVQQYRDALVRHRRSMLALNTAVGRRILP